MHEWQQDRVGSAERGTNPMVIARMESGYAVMGDTQFLPGYCVLLASPRIGQLSDLPMPRRITFLRDMAILGEAVERACADQGLSRVNYEILGNTDPFLHAHIFPRYAWEPTNRQAMPVFLYPRENWTSPKHAYDDARHSALRLHITEVLDELKVIHI